MIDKGLSSLFFIGFISFTSFYCLNYHQTHASCSDIGTSVFMVALGLLVIINFVIFLIMRGLRKRMLFGIQMDKEIAAHRNTNSSLDSYLLRTHQPIEMADTRSSSRPLDVAARLPAPRAKPSDHNYINLISSGLHRM